RTAMAGAERYRDRPFSGRPRLTIRTWSGRWSGSRATPCTTKAWMSADSNVDASDATSYTLVESVVSDPSRSRNTRAPTNAATRAAPADSSIEPLSEHVRPVNEPHEREQEPVPTEIGRRGDGKEPNEGHEQTRRQGRPLDGPGWADPGFP